MPREASPHYFAPLLWGPILPCIRIALRGKPRLQMPVMSGAIALAFAHGAWVISTLNLADADVPVPAPAIPANTKPSTKYDR
eukprot:m.103702 g.103702  ORF g.103702 m.103702 type:complete len:82 (-) comp9074_c0_seq1:113-358(-)